MPRTLSATEIQDRFGQIVADVQAAQDVIIVEDAGAPAVVIISIDEYRRLRAMQSDVERNEAVAELERIRIEVARHQTHLTEDEADALAQEIEQDLVKGLVDKGIISYER